MDLKNKYAIVGVGYTPQGRVPGRTSLSFHLEASSNAIDDAGLKHEDIDGLLSYRSFSPCPGEVDATPQVIAQHLGLGPSFMGQDAN